MALHPNITKSLAFRLLALLLSLLSLIAFSAILHLIPQGPMYSDGFGAEWKALPLSANSYSILVCSIALLVGLLSKRDAHRPSAIHPGVAMAADFLGWGGNWLLGILILISKQENYYSNWLCDLGSGPVTTPDEVGGCARARKVEGVEIMVGVIGILVGIIHMSFLFRGWSDLYERRRNARQRGKVVELGAIESA